MIRVPISFPIVLVLNGPLGATEQSAPVQALCQHAPVRMFKPSQAPRMPDDELLRALLTTDAPNAIERAVGKVDVNALRGTTKTTPLALAAATGNLNGMKVLLANGAKIDVRAADGTTALESAILNAQPAAACILMNRGALLPLAPSKPYLLPSAALSEDFESATTLVEFLLGEGYDVNAKMNGDAALHIAAELGNVSLVRLLVRHGANRGIRNNRAETPEAVATRVGNQAIARMLHVASQ